MGLVRTEITLRNAGDEVRIQHGIIAEREAREITVQALADTGAGTLVISEEVRQRLGLEIVGLRGATLANDRREICKVTEPVNIHWKDRESTVRALVASGSGEVLVGAHGDEILCYLKSVPA